MILKGSYRTQDPRMDRVPSATTEHLEKYPITKKALTSANSSMMVAINWYDNFSKPVQRYIKSANRWVIGEGQLGVIRGSHAVCGRNWFLRDTVDWWRYYDQGYEGRCVEFASLRVLSHMNRKRYDITSGWHYHEAQHIDEWAGCVYGHDGGTYEGTSGRAGLEVLRSMGAIPALLGGADIPKLSAFTHVRSEEGISAYRWATSWDQVRQALKVPDDLPGIPLNNSWGTGYPREVLLLDEAGERVLNEDGELGIVTDK